jgi:hypothetical protein
MAEKELKYLYFNNIKSTDAGKDIPKCIYLLRKYFWLKMYKIFMTQWIYLSTSESIYFSICFNVLWTYKDEVTCFLNIQLQWRFHQSVRVAEKRLNGNPLKCVAGSITFLGHVEVPCVDVCVRVTYFFSFLFSLFLPPPPPSILSYVHIVFIL